MRANGFKKALILAAAAFVTAVIGIGGAKLKVQAAEWESGKVLSCYHDGGHDITTDGLIALHDIVKNGVVIHLADNSSGHYYTMNYTYEYKDGTFSSSLGGVPNFTVSNTYDACTEWEVTALTPTADPVDPSKPGMNITLTARTYDVVWVDGDGNTLKTDKLLKNETPAYTGATPTKSPSGGYTYLWDSTWTPAVTNVTADATYVANFTGTLTNYTITWKNDDGTTLRTDTVAAGSLPSYGGTPSKPDDANYTYTFSMWSPTVQLATANATYTAVYLQDPKPAPATGGGEDDSSSSTGDGSSSGDGTNGGANGNRAPKTADTMPGIIVIALAGLLGGALLITGGRKASK